MSTHEQVQNNRFERSAERFFEKVALLESGVLPAPAYVSHTVAPR